MLKNSVFPIGRNRSHETPEVTSFVYKLHLRAVIKDFECRSDRASYDIIAKQLKEIMNFCFKIYEVFNNWIENYSIFSLRLDRESTTLASTDSVEISVNLVSNINHSRSS